jgi:hypothetical protein
VSFVLWRELYDNIGGKSFNFELLPRQVPGSSETHSDAVMVRKLHGLVLAAGSDYFHTRLCTPSSSDGLLYTDGDKVLVERVADGDEKGMEAYLEFLYKESFDESLPLRDMLAVLKVSFLARQLSDWVLNFIRRVYVWIELMSYARTILVHFICLTQPH